MTSDNSLKWEHGKNRQGVIKEILDVCIKTNLIEGYKEGLLKWGEPGYKKDQFYVQTLIEFKNHEFWALYSSTTLRDRMKMVYWDVFNVKRLDENISNCLFVYPKDCKEVKKFEKLKRDFDAGQIYCNLDYIVSTDELFTLIQEHALNGLSSGSIKGRRGNNFEKFVSAVLSSKNNLAKLNETNSLAIGNSFDMFEMVIKKIQGEESIELTQISKIVATTEVPRLPSGGKPKADVFATIYLKDNIYKEISISCKQTNDDWVSVHEYDWKEFSRVLNPNDKKLAMFLSLFQKKGGVQSFGKENCDLLENALSPYLEKLNLWVLGGLGGNGTLDVQCAKYILCYNDTNGKFSFHTIIEYIQLLKEKNVQGQFGTLFKWTYSSGNKGKTIQLKGRVLL